jgi:hypothetical protein
MAEQDSKPTVDGADSQPEETRTTAVISSRHLLSLGLGLVVLVAGCFWWGSQPTEPNAQETLATPTITQTSATSRPPQSNAALTRVASSLAQARESTPTAAPVQASTPAGHSANPTGNTPNAEIPLPTVTPTLVPSPVATRTIELRGDATLRLHLDSENFQTNGQPVTMNIEPRSYVLGGDTMTQQDQWCMQVGATGLVFDLNYTLQPVTENLLVGGELQLYDGFCGEWGKLGNLLSAVPLNVTIPAGTAAELAPALQVQGSFLGLPGLLDISTGVFLNLTIRNPTPR